jgi:hypothetical protein
MLIPRARSGESDSDAEDLEHAEKLRQVKAVLEEVRCLDIFVTFPHVIVVNVVLGKSHIIRVLNLYSLPAAVTVICSCFWIYNDLLLRYIWDFYTGSVWNWLFLRNFSLILDL